MSDLVFTCTLVLVIIDFNIPPPPVWVSKMATYVRGAVHYSIRLTIVWVGDGLTVFQYRCLIVFLRAPPLCVSCDGL